MYFVPFCFNFTISEGGCRDNDAETILGSSSSKRILFRENQLRKNLSARAAKPD